MTHGKDPYTLLRQESIWETYLEVCKEFKEESERMFREVRKGKLYEEVSNRTNYRASYVGKIVRAKLKCKTWLLF